jgi:multiple sugar transport system permease protein
VTSRAQVEDRLFGVLRWVMIAFLAAITIAPFLYMLMLSVKPVDALLLNPGRL